MNPDFLDIIRALSDADARFLIVGADAVNLHTDPRATGDLDIWIEPPPKNAARVMEALVRIGQRGLRGILPSGFQVPNAMNGLPADPYQVVRHANQRVDVLAGGFLGEQEPLLLFLEPLLPLVELLLPFLEPLHADMGVRLVLKNEVHRALNLFRGHENVLIRFREGGHIISSIRTDAARPSFKER